MFFLNVLMRVLRDVKLHVTLISECSHPGFTAVFNTVTDTEIFFKNHWKIFFFFTKKVRAVTTRSQV